MHDEWIAFPRRYLPEGSMDKIYPPDDPPDTVTRTSSRVPARTTMTGPAVSAPATVTPVKCRSREGSSTPHNGIMPGSNQATSRIPVAISGYGKLARAT